MSRAMTTDSVAANAVRMACDIDGSSSFFQVQSFIAPRFSAVSAC